VFGEDLVAAFRLEELSDVAALDDCLSGIAAVSTAQNYAAGAAREREPGPTLLHPPVEAGVG
jgi:hypothetical protein